jgi:hypothetical protein
MPVLSKAMSTLAPCMHAGMCHTSLPAGPVCTQAMGEDVWEEFSSNRFGPWVSKTGALSMEAQPAQLKCPMHASASSSQASEQHCFGRFA